MLADSIILITLGLVALNGFQRGFLTMTGRLMVLLVSLGVSFLMLGPTALALDSLPFINDLAVSINNQIIYPLMPASASVADAIADLQLPAPVEHFLLGVVSANRRTFHRRLAAIICHHRPIPGQSGHLHHPFDPGFRGHPHLGQPDDHRSGPCACSGWPQPPGRNSGRRASRSLDLGHCDFFYQPFGALFPSPGPDPGRFLADPAILYD